MAEDWRAISHLSKKIEAQKWWIYLTLATLIAFFYRETCTINSIRDLE